MDRVAVTSSTLASVGYDEAQQLLEVEFLSGNLYQYSGVPAGEHQALMAAETLGGYFNANIRNAYPYMRL